MIIRKITFFIIVRDLNLMQHEFVCYVILFIYFINTKNSAFVKIFIEREIHLVKNFKINMLINNNVIASKKIFINIINRETNIRSCDVTILLNVRFKNIYF